MSVGQDRALNSVIHKNTPKYLDPKLVQYLIDFPLFTQAAIEQFFAELQVPNFDSNYSGILYLEDGFDANDALQKHGTVAGRKPVLEALERELSVRPKAPPTHPHLHWSLKPTTTRLVKLVMGARRHRPATPFELVAYVARGWHPRDGIKSLVAPQAFLVDHQPHVLMFTSNADRQLCWTIEFAERVWPMTAGFLALGAEI